MDHLKGESRLSAFMDKRRPAPLFADRSYPRTFLSGLSSAGASSSSARLMKDEAFFSMPGLPSVASPPHRESSSSSLSSVAIHSLVVQRSSFPDEKAGQPWACKQQSIPDSLPSIGSMSEDTEDDNMSVGTAEDPDDHQYMGKRVYEVQDNANEGEDSRLFACSALTATSNADVTSTIIFGVCTTKSDPIPVKLAI
eukprot:CAMPEP_0198320718 /NCGR_PEP_ID=MMETSP1450-20131203/9594_1 /TAXON_ID=753684 ORGANISM="Madagascaria erythrocladiodes, Strain CCMP3234" /NCGR_SAMPLE_ID=MMETSP1450 /ASSEMBLY_ACC=CAM_ASM_001115 /LENGTH=195 /DNA_ID=CAMNT_0044024209 /DNA_START=164 /DNA_END=752 /DNA_ORIENTATION=+